MRPQSSNKSELQPTSSIVPRPIDSAIRVELNKNIFIWGYKMVDFVLNFVTLSHPRYSEILFFRKSRIPDKWKNGILGKHNRKTLEPFCLPSILTIQTRIQEAIEFSFLQKLSNPFSFFFNQASGLSWLPSSSPPPVVIDYEKITLESVSLFSQHLDSLLHDSQQTLDELAGVVILVKHPPVVRAVRRLMKLAPPPHVEKIDLKTRRGPDGKLGGTVIAIHQFLSAEFLAYYLVDHDSACAYMQDIRSAHKKDRKLRVASIHHVSNQPIWLQFGSGDSAYLYLSRAASAAEEKWLIIVNYVMNLLVQFVNTSIESACLPHNVPKDKLLRLRQYGTLVGNTGHPSTGNYGRHHDAKPGLVDPSDPSYSRFQIMVPTLCLQNHPVSNTRISWFPNEDPTWAAGSVSHEFCLFHIQGVGVQEHFEHEVGWS
jgi:hypothetical protein